MKIELIPMDELRKDRQESIDDIALCERALEHKVYAYSGGLTKDRLVGNKKIVTVIDFEI